MLDRLRKFLAPPIMEEEDQQITALLLNTVLVILLFLIVTVIPLLFLVGQPQQPLFTVGIALLLTFGILILKYLMGRGFLRFASWLVSLGLIAIIGALIFQFGGLRDINTFALAVALTVGSLLLRERRSIIMITTVAILVGVAAYVAEARGLVTYPPQPLQAPDLILFVVIVGMVSAVLAYATQNLDAALTRARGSERQAAEALEQVEAMNEDLEARVAARTRALQLSANVSRRLSTILDQEELIQAVVNQLRDTFDYYHVHIYLWAEDGAKLRMVGGTGEPGRLLLEKQHTIERGKGLVGRAAATNLPILVSDVSKEAEWLPNPLLPETRAEIAVPIARGDEVIGVLDVQQNVREGLTGEDVDLIQAVTNQIAVALQNAQLYRQAQRRAADQQLLNTITAHIQAATSVEQALQVAVRELGWALDGQTARVNLRPAGDRAGTPAGN